jgi:hypothetical protein
MPSKDSFQVEWPIPVNSELIMGLALNVVLLLLGLASALAAFGGETWRKNSKPLFKRVTHRGWIALALMFLTVVIGTVKEIRSSSESAKSKAELQKSNDALASIEPTLVQALTLTTAGIRRESDFSTPTLDGSEIALAPSADTNS